MCFKNLGKTSRQCRNAIEERDENNGARGSHGGKCSILQHNPMRHDHESHSSIHAISAGLKHFRNN